MVVLGLSMLEECLVTEELAWGCSGISTAIGVNSLGMLPILVAGSEEQKTEYGNRMADGELCAYCVTEPEAGSDVAGILTTAIKDGDDYILNGNKTFITGATNANFYTVLAYTDPELRDTKSRHKGMSFFVVERDWDGVSVGKPFDKLGQHASDTAEVIFDQVQGACHAPPGRGGQGFLLRHERLRPQPAFGGCRCSRCGPAGYG